MNIKGQTGLYFHWPFCLAKCPYCDFNVHVRESVDVARFEAAYLKSLEYYKYLLPERVIKSVYFGGGTPSLIPPDMIGRILDKMRSLWGAVNDLEVTLEANPTSIEAEKFLAFKEAGVNRVSIGVQAMNDQDLAFLGRKHSKDEAIAALGVANDVFDRFSFDLIYARPEQSLKDWSQELEFAATFAKGHMSLYQLTVERNTPFYFDHARGRFILPKEDVAADFYSLTAEIMADMGMPLYEVSNYAGSGDDQSRHNLQYWHYGEYIGIGPGAHGRIETNGVRHSTRDHHAPESWLAWVEERGCGAHPFEALSAAAKVTECLMMGLRLAEGLPFARIEEHAGRKWDAVLDRGKMDALVQEGWLSYDEERMVLSVEGLLRLNAIIPFIERSETAKSQAAR